MSVLRLLIVRTRRPAARMVDTGISRGPDRGELLAVMFAVMASDAGGSVGLVKAKAASSRFGTGAVLDNASELVRLGCPSVTASSGSSRRRGFPVSKLEIVPPSQAGKLRPQSLSNPPKASVLNGSWPTTEDLSLPILMTEKSSPKLPPLR